MKRVPQVFKKTFFGLACLVIAAIMVQTVASSPACAGTITVPGTSDPWLAGMPDGSTASGNDSAPGQSPVEVKGLTLVPGSFLTFSARGIVDHLPSDSGNGPEGNPGWLMGHDAGEQNGISNIYSAPINSLVGVFLTSDEPNLSLAPAMLDFSKIGLDYPTLSPQIQQVFFIGDGLIQPGGDSQRVFVPVGATRLFLGTMDGYEWNNNVGYFDVTVSSSVPEPATFLLFGGGLVGLAAYRRRSRKA